MDVRVQLLEQIKQKGLAQGNLLGLFHVFIGRRIAADDGTLVCNGNTWRELAALLKKVRWERADVAHLGLDVEALPPRDRERFWYTAIAQSKIESEEARKAGDKLAEKIGSIGYQVGPPPT
jgi:hypothetical protein